MTFTRTPLITGNDPRRRPGFTLIELLVVVAIIALLIAILLPSLTRVRSQARTALCGTRIGQLGKAMLMYAGDFNEYPPFMGATGEWYPDLQVSVGGRRDPNENWIFQLPASWTPDVCRDRMYAARQEDWGVDVPRSGTLYTYTRFEHLYRCPEFERIVNPEKTQSVFNYTRLEFARRFRIPPGWGPEFPSEGGYVMPNPPLPIGDFKGPILRTSAIHSPGMLPMVADEQWDRHVARPPALFNEENDDIKYHWVDTDPLLCTHDELGQYHAPKVQESEYYNPARPIERGGVLYYDGHVDLRRDPYPSPWNGGRKENPGDILGYMCGVAKYQFEAIFAQRGLRPPMAVPEPPWPR
jgi:prepilin-type N-terminal cleavage/methylation domain-containing protein